MLTVVSGGLQKWLRSRGTRTEGLELRALVPVSIRTHEQRGSLGNQLAAMRGPLPVYVEDPIARLKVVRASMDGLKESKQALGAEVLAGVQNFTPPTVMAQASRLNFSTRLFNLLVTNVPGPQIPLYVLGRELQDIFPLAFLPRHHALAVAIMSYNGSMDFGLLGDYDAMHDLDAFGEMVDDSLKELVDGRQAAARVQRPGEAEAEAGGQEEAGRQVEGEVSSVAERELRVLGHLVRGPRRREDHRRDDLVDTVDLAHELLHLLGDLRADRAGGRGERERDVDLAAVDRDVVDQAELDEVEPELRIDDVGERFSDVFLGEHTLRIVRCRFPGSSSMTQSRSSCSSRGMRTGRRAHSAGVRSPRRCTRRATSASTCPNCASPTPR